MRSIALLALLGVAATSAYDFENAPTKDVHRGKFGALEITDYKEAGMSKTVHMPDNAYHLDYNQQSTHLKEAVKQIKENKERMADGRIYTCSDRVPGVPESDIGMFFPVRVGALSVSSPKVSFGEGRCFESINFWYDTVYNGTEVQEVTVWIETEKPKSALCKDWFFFGSSELYHVDTFFYSGKHSITFNNLSPSAKKDIAFGGI